MSEVAPASERGSGDSGCFLRHLGLQDQKVNESSGMFGTRNFLAAMARKASCFCGLALSKQLLFVLSSSYFVQKRATVMGRKAQFFQGLPLSVPLLTAGFMTRCISTAQGQVSCGRKTGFAALR